MAGQLTRIVTHCPFESISSFWPIPGRSSVFSVRHNIDEGRPEVKVGLAGQDQDRVENIKYIYIRDTLVFLFFFLSFSIWVWIDLLRRHFWLQENKRNHCSLQGVIGKKSSNILWHLKVKWITFCCVELTLVSRLQRWEINGLIHGGNPPKTLAKSLSRSNWGWIEL